MSDDRKIDIEPGTPDKYKELREANTYIFDWDDTVVNYIPREHILHFVHAFISNCEKHPEIFDNPKAYFEIPRKGEDWKKYLEQVRKVSQHMFGDENYLFKTATSFVRSVSTEKGRTRVIKDKLPTESPGGVWSRYRELFLKTERPFDDYLELNPGIMDFIKKAKGEGKKLFLISNSSSAVVMPVLRHIESRLSQQIFDGVVCLRDKEDRSWDKPNPISLHEMVTDKRLDPTKVVYFGNTVEDMDFASKAGVIPCMVNPETQEGVKYQFRDFSELNNIIG